MRDTAYYETSTADLHKKRRDCGVFIGVLTGLLKNFVVGVCRQQAQFAKFTEKAMACLDEGGELWYSNDEKSITDKRSAQFRVLNKL